MIAVARLFFDNVNHLQGSWLTTGKDIGQLTLHYGADDLGSVMLEENVVSSAGARHRSNRTELIDLIRGAGRIPAQRDTLYRHLVVHTDPAERPGRRPRPLALLVHRPDPDAGVAPRQCRSRRGPPGRRPCTQDVGSRGLLRRIRPTTWVQSGGFDGRNSSRGRQPAS